MEYEGDNEYMCAKCGEIITPDWAEAEWAEGNETGYIVPYRCMNCGAEGELQLILGRNTAWDDEDEDEV